MSETRNVFYPMWLRARKIGSKPYVQFLKEARQLQWGPDVSTILADAAFVTREFVYGIENLSLTWEDAVNLLNPSAARQSLWDTMGHALQGKDVTKNLGFTEKILKDLLSRVGQTYPNVNKNVRIYVAK